MLLVEIRFTQAARKHRIGHASVRYVMAHTTPSETTTDQGNPAWRYIGLDERNRELEVIVVEVDGDAARGAILLVIHVMQPTREEVIQMPKRTAPPVTVDTPIGSDVDLDREDIRLADGTRLTSEIADGIVNQAPRSSGRPSLSGSPAASPQIAFRVAPSVRDRAERVAAREGKTISQLAREALEERVAASG